MNRKKFKGIKEAFLTGWNRSHVGKQFRRKENMMQCPCEGSVKNGKKKTGETKDGTACQPRYQDKPYAQQKFGPTPRKR
jgi:hypothetical protein